MAGKHLDSSASNEKKTTSLIRVSKHEAASKHQTQLDFMKAGCKLIKVRSKFSKNKRHFYIDQDCLLLKYDGSQKNRWWRKLFRKSVGHDNNNLPIATIEEIRKGGSSGKFCVAYTLGSRRPPNDHCLSIVYFGETLDLVAETRDIRDNWLDGLTHLHAQIKSADPVELKNLELRAMFKLADVNGDNRLSANEIVLLMNKMNIEIDTYSVQLSTQKETFDLDDFIKYVERIRKRREINDIFKKYDNDNNYLTAEELQQFFHLEQKEEIKLTTCEEIIQKHEHTPQLKDKGWLSLEGFYSFLSSDHMCIQRAECKTVYQDMTQPLSHYFIDSSHNTYLEAGQINSYSTNEAYIRALRSGCRCVEMDVWDGDSGPVIQHGYAMTSRLLFEEVVTVTNTYAFEASKYPLILSIENHCSVEQQKQMAQIMKTIFGDTLYLGPLSQDQALLPTPAELMGKVIVKCKKREDLSSSSLNVNEVDLEYVEPPELKQLDTGDGTKKTPKKHKIAVELSDCVVILQTASFKSFAHSKEKQLVEVLERILT